MATATKQAPKDSEQIVIDAQRVKDELFAKEKARIEIEQELKAEKSVARQAAQAVRDKQRAELLDKRRKEMEHADRNRVRNMSRPERIAYRRRLTGGYFPDHIRDELDRCDGLQTRPLDKSELTGLTVQDLQEEIARRSGTPVKVQIPMNAPVTQRELQEENAAE